MTRARVDVLDLTLDQVETVETAVGAPFQDWGGVSRVALARHVLAVTGQIPADQVGSMTVRELSDAITLDGDEGTDANP